MRIFKIITLLIVFVFCKPVISKPSKEESLTILIHRLGYSEIRESILAEMKPKIESFNKELVEKSWDGLERELKKFDFESVIRTKLLEHLSEDEILEINLFLDTPAGQKKSNYTKSELKELEAFNNSPAGQKLVSAMIAIFPELIEHGNEWLHQLTRRKEEAQIAYQNTLKLIEDHDYSSCSEDDISSIIVSDVALEDNYNAYFDAEEKLSKFERSSDYRVRLDMYQKTIVSLDNLLKSKYLVEKGSCSSKIVNELNEQRSYLDYKVNYINEALMSGKLEQECNQYEIDDILKDDEELLEKLIRRIPISEAVKESDKSENAKQMIASRREELVVLNSLIDSEYVKNKKKCHSEISSFYSGVIDFLESEISKIKEKK